VVATSLPPLSELLPQVRQGHILHRDQDFQLVDDVNRLVDEFLAVVVFDRQDGFGPLLAEFLQYRALTVLVDGWRATTTRANRLATRPQSARSHRSRVRVAHCVVGVNPIAWPSSLTASSTMSSLSAPTVVTTSDSEMTVGYRGWM